MKRTAITALLASLALAAGLGWIGTSGAAPPPAAAPALTDCAPHCGAMLLRASRGKAGRRALLAQAIRNDPAIAVVVNLRAIERVYRHEGRTPELPAFYAGVLERTDDPLVRNFVNYRLARLEMREQDARGALDALMRNLDENLRRIR
jgi:hypothetical protein